MGVQGFANVVSLQAGAGEDARNKGRVWTMPLTNYNMVPSIELEYDCVTCGRADTRRVETQAELSVSEDDEN